MAAIDLSGRTILFLVGEDGYFLSHRLPLARAARDAGARVVLGARFGAARARIEDEGIITCPIPFDRAGMNPVRDLATLRAISALYRAQRPDLVHQVAMKPVLYGSLAALRNRIPLIVNALPGLGYLQSARSVSARMLRPVLWRIMRRIHLDSRVHLVLQNDADYRFFADDLRVPEARLRLIRGVGVDIQAFSPRPEPPGPPVALCASRMLWDKGIGELVDAARILRREGSELIIRLAGAPDANPASISAEQLQQWAREGIVDYIGHSADMAEEYARAHIAVLPSYHEGLPKSLLEAAAMGRPMVTTDIAGCRDICLHGENGLLVSPRQSEPLARALARLAGDASLRQHMGRAAREHVTRHFAEPLITRQMFELYAEKLDRLA